MSGRIRKSVQEYRILFCSEMPVKMFSTLESDVIVHSYARGTVIMYHFVLEGGNAEIYGFTNFSYNSGVSCTMICSCFEYLFHINERHLQ